MARSGEKGMEGGGERKGREKAWRVGVAGAPVVFVLGASTPTCPTPVTILTEVIEMQE